MGDRKGEIKRTIERESAHPLDIALKDVESTLSSCKADEFTFPSAFTPKSNADMQLQVIENNEQFYLEGPREFNERK